MIHLNLFMRTDGHHFAAWRHPLASPDLIQDVQNLVTYAQLAEQGCFDSVFLGDSPALGSNPWSYLIDPLEPLSVLSAVAASTSRIGVIGTFSTTYYEPYNLARQMASLDHISRGRAGWNIVTSQSPRASANFGSSETMAHSDRYRRAAEFVGVVDALWSSWDEDALVADKAAGVYVDPDRVHPINHHGEFFDVAGPLNVGRPPQGRPLLVQAGSSSDGIAFGASIADAIFTAQHELAAAQTFYAELKTQATALGRRPDSITILPGLTPLLADTESAARHLAKELEDLMVPRFSVATMSEMLGVDLSAYPLDAPVPLEQLPEPSEVQGAQSRHRLIADMCRDKRLTIRQLVHWHIGGRGHRLFVGTPDQLVDEMQLWVNQRAADGFNIMPALTPNDLPIFVDQVVPELQRRGLFRSDYETDTLRGHYGLERWVSAAAPRLVSVDQ